MNFFNCFQAVAFYTLLPFLLNWAHKNNNKVAVAIGSCILMIGYVLLSWAVYEAANGRIL